MESLKIDLVVDEPKSGEFVLCLVESPPWHEEPLADRMRKIQNRIYLAVDAILDGYVAQKYPESSGRAMRIQVDAYSSPPEIETLISNLNNFVNSEKDYLASVGIGKFAVSLRIVTGRSMGRIHDE